MGERFAGTTTDSRLAETSLFAAMVPLMSSMFTAKSRVISAGVECGKIPAAYQSQRLGDRKTSSVITSPPMSFVTNARPARG